uniref:fructose-bisphosphatase class III n=1 Tax=Anaeromassilibacillus senegalensis TaxID=1673717 RepID=UPI000680E33A|nr:fructose-bisphosphatase class III [Anaeromassilibacillus senegalensis]
MVDPHYLRLLAREYPNADAAASEIINLNAIRYLPKGTEYFFSDLHGEYEAFGYLLNSASGIIRDKIEWLFQKSVGLPDREELADLIYKPEPVLAAKEKGTDAYHEWCRITIYRLVQVCKTVSSKYTRSKVRKKMPEQFAYIIDELLHADTEETKEQYYGEIIHSIIRTDMAEPFIIAISRLIRQCSIDMLHIIGDIFDRGPHADIVMDELMGYHDVDIQWGNHDISWMGAATGNLALVANVVRLGISYNNFDLLEDGYGINLRALSMFAAEVYQDDPCTIFTPHILDENTYDPVDIPLAAKMHKAIAIIQFKLEGQLIARHPEYQMEDRILLDKIDFRKGTISIQGQTYELTDRLFPTVSPECPLELTQAEEDLIHTLAVSFAHSERLAKHIKYLYAHGGMYKCVNSNLLYHGCIPMTEDGAFDCIPFGDTSRCGRELLDYIDDQVHCAYFAVPGSAERQNASDFLWYLWCGPKSPLFGKSKLAAFERYFILEPETHVERRNPYYSLIEDRSICEKILREFGLDPTCSHIVNGHVPVKIRQGESPIKAGGLLFIIDGGISKAYQKQTGIGGYTLIFNSHHLALAQHKPYELAKQNLSKNAPSMQIVEIMPHRLTVNDTDNGRNIARQIEELTELLKAYRSGQMKER